jgi:hypothetical protein
MLDLPVVLTNCVLGPLRSGSKATFTFEAETGDYRISHLRRRGLTEVDANVVLPLASEVDDHVTEPCLYGGPLIDHFGHMVADGLHRIWPIHAFDFARELPVVFLSRGGLPPNDQRWLWDIFALCGLERDRVRVLQRVTRFATLHVPALGRVMGEPARIEGYGEIFPRPTSQRPRERKRAGLMYVSRHRHLHSGGYFGEGYLQRTLESCGFSVVYPEDHRPLEFVDMLRSVRGAVFAEGSAIHNLDLIGRSGIEVFVVGRKGGAQERFAPILSEVCNRWHVAEHVRDGLAMTWSDGPDLRVGNYFIDLRATLEDIGSFFGVNLQPYDNDAAQRETAIDVLRYLLDERSTRRRHVSDAQLGVIFKSIRESPAIRELLASLSR